MNIKKLLFIAVAALASLMPIAAQQPQSNGPLFAANAKYTNGVAPGYAPTVGTGLNLNIGGGTSFCNGTIVTYAAGTLSLTASNTNYVYLDTTSSCTVSSNTSGFTGTDIPIAVVTTSVSTITNITDDRTLFFTSIGGTTSISVNGTAVSSPNFNNTTPAASSNFLNIQWQHSSSSVSAQIPFGSGSGFGVLECGSGTSCSGGVITVSGTGVASVTNSDGTLTISPTTGNVIAGLNLAHANTWTATQTLTATLGFDASSATQVKLPVAAGYASAANGELGYDTTNKNWHGWVNGADKLFIPLAPGFASGDCGEPTSSGGSWTIADTGVPCGSGSGGVTSLNSLTGALAVAGDSTITVTPSGANINLHVPPAGIASTTGFVFAGDSKNDDDSNAIEPTFPVSTFSCTGVTCTVVNTGTNGLAAGDWVNMRFSPAWLSTFTAPTDIALSTGYTLFKVISTGLSSTQFEFSFSGTGTCASTCGNAAKATFNLPFNTTSKGALAGVGSTSVVIPNPVNIITLSADYSTILHPLSPAVTGNPGYLIIGDEEDDVASGSCPSAATIETAFQTLWAAAHTDGYKVVEWSASAFSYNQTGIGSCTNGYYVLSQVEIWLSGQSKNVTNYANGQYWDLFADVGQIINDANNSNLVASNGGFGQGGVGLASNDIAQVIVTGVSDPLSKKVEYFGSPASQSSAGNGFLYQTTTDTIRGWTWLDTAGDWLYSFGVQSGFRHVTVNSDSTNLFQNTDTGGANSTVMSINELGTVSTGANNPIFTSFTPNLPTSTTPFWLLGHDSGAQNSFGLSFHYGAAGSTSNYSRWTVNGDNGVRVDGLGNFTIESISSSTSPLCPNGTGGALTISGCQAGFVNPMTTLGDMIYGGASGTPTRLAGPTTSGHTFVFAAQPSGSSIAPAWVDLGSFIGTNVTGTSPIVATPGTLGTVISCPSCSVGSGTNITINGGSSLGSANLNDTTPAAATNGINVKWQIASGNVSAYILGDGNTSHFLRGDGTFAAPPSGGNYANLCSLVTLTNATCSGGIITVSTAASFTISSIPGTYLNLEGYIQGTSSAGGDIDVNVQFNGDSTAGDYNCHRFGVVSSTTLQGVACSTIAASGTVAFAIVGPTSGQGGAKFSIIGYSNSSANKIMTGAGWESADPAAFSYDAAWKNTGAITSMVFTLNNGANFTGTTLTLYGTN